MKLKSKVFTLTIGCQQCGYAKKAASLPQLAHRIHYSEKAVQGVTGTAKVSSRFPLFGSGETNIKLHLKLKCNSSIPQHCKMTSSAAGPSNQLTCKAWACWCSFTALNFETQLSPTALTVWFQQFTYEMHIQVWNGGLGLETQEKNSLQHFRVKQFFLPENQHFQ